MNLLGLVSGVEFARNHPGQGSVFNGSMDAESGVKARRGTRKRLEGERSEVNCFLWSLE